MMEHSMDVAAERVRQVVEAEAIALGDPAFARAVWKAAGRLLPEGKGSLPPEQPPARGWAARIMIFNSAGELVADSMPDMDPSEPPDTEIATLSKIGDWVRETAYQYHQSNADPQPVGLDADTLSRSILSLRVTLSRNGGSSWWRIPYTVGDQVCRITVRVERR